MYTPTFILGKTELFLSLNYDRCLSHNVVIDWYLTDVIVKVADVKASNLADVIAIVIWDGVNTHILI